MLNSYLSASSHCAKQFRAIPSHFTDYVKLERYTRCVYLYVLRENGLKKSHQKGFFEEHDEVCLRYCEDEELDEVCVFVSVTMKNIAKRVSWLL
jgi:SPX domain protein involved in polyphosphate accumulation